MTINTTNSKSVTLGIALVQWNHAHYTTSLLATLLDSTEISHIAITDNNSSPEEIEHIQNEVGKLVSLGYGSKVTTLLMLNKFNSGFAQAMNESIARLLAAGIDWIWLLNNDVRIERSAIRDIAKKLISAPPGIVGCPMTEGDDAAFSGSYKFNRWTSLIKPIETAKGAARIDQKKRYISGANMLVHREVFESVGLLNPKTFLYFEEMDFIRRALKNGFEQSVLDCGMVYHEGSASSNHQGFQSKRIYHETWSTLYFYRTHQPWLFIPCLIGRTAVRSAALTLTGRSVLVKSVIVATRDFLMGKNIDSQIPEIHKVIELT